MNAHAASKRPDKVQQCRLMLDRLLENYETSRHFHGARGAPTLSAVPFTVVLNAVANSPSQVFQPKADNYQVLSDPFGVGDGKDATTATEHETGDGYQIALDTYHQLRDQVFSVPLDHFALATMIQVVARHTLVDSTERRQQLLAVIQDAQSTGQLSSLVIQNLQRAAPTPELLREWLQWNKDELPSSINAFPRAWTINVPASFRRMRHRRGKSQRDRSDGTAKEVAQAVDI